uniref:Uncharacterized protein n=1 Tax=Platysiphonia delicata TaxID=2006979 RepID=A0A1Z1M1C9_9FLOR|nr:hypothetical protein [Platysiphonia delicata]ARW59573.1 hypothetical protein [Platysiphonia delicata]
MNLSYLSLYSQYLHSPTTFLHQISVNRKAFFLLSILIYISYIPYVNVSHYVIFLIYTKFLFKNKKGFYLLLNTTYMIISTYIYIYINNKFFVTKNKGYSYIYLPISIKIKNYCTNKFFLCKLIINCYAYSIPKFIIKIINIHITYEQIRQLIFFSTRFEKINILLIKVFNHNNLINLKKKNYFITVLILLFQFTERTIYNILTIEHGIKIKYGDSIKIYILILIVYKAINKYIKNIFLDIYNAVLTLWNMEIYDLIFFTD